MTKSKKSLLLFSLAPAIILILGALYINYSNPVFIKEAEKTYNSSIYIIKVGENEFEAEIAGSQAERARGLSGTDMMLKNKAMYFDLERDQVASFWMKEMLFDLDIVWIHNNRVVGIEKNVPKPKEGEDLIIYTSPVIVDSVLEINAGLSDELGINLSDEVFIIENK